MKPRAFARRHLLARLSGLTSLLGIGTTGFAQEKPGSPYGDLKEVTFRGRLVALEDEMARKYGAKVAKPSKQLALALPEGQLYTFLAGDGYRKLEESTVPGSALEIRARLFPRSMLLEVLAFAPIAPETIQRRFFCDVCTIFMVDWGPCVCCGKEVVPVQDSK